VPLRRESFIDGTYAYDARDPAGYRSGVVQLTKAVGWGALAVKAFEIPPGEALCPFHYEFEEE
jgi:uncharacterized cupin superfamily protein